MQSSQPWDEFRRQMPVVEKWAYFDHAAVAPLSGPAKAALDEWAADAAVNGAVNWKAWRERVEEVRRLGGALVGADQDEIAVIRNTTEGVNLVAEGFPWKAGDNVVTLTSEFPTNRFGWLHLAERGVEARLVPTENERVDLDRIAETCDSRTRIVAVSWVGYQTGWRNDVDALVDVAHQQGALLFLDAIQALGVFPLDVTKTAVDFLAADGHKWLLGPEGAGLFFTRREHLTLLRPMGIGWNSAQNAGDFSEQSLTLKQTAGRYEGGSYNLAGITALGASLRLLSDYGARALSERLLSVTDLLCERLNDCGAQIVNCRDRLHRSGIVAFTLPGENPQRVRQRCLEQGVIVNCRAGRLRISPHVYTNEDDIDRLIAALSGLRGGTQPTPRHL